MTKELMVCPFISEPDKIVHCMKEQCRAYMKICEDKYEICEDGTCTIGSHFKGICLLIPGDCCR